MNKHRNQRIQSCFHVNVILPCAWHHSVVRQCKKKATLSMLLLVLFFMGQQVFAQSSTTTDVTGVVLNEKGEVMQGAAVVATNTITHTAITSATDNNGNFR